MNWKAWLYGLVAALVGAAINALSVLVGVAVFDATQLMDKKFWMAAGCGILAAALKTALAYLKQSPLPPLAQIPGAGN